MQDRIQVQDSPLDLNEWVLALQGDPQCGAVVTFTGSVRDLTDGGLNGLYLEHYPQMTEAALNKIVRQAHERWDLGAVHVVHRVGRILPAEPIVFVGVSSGHRAAAFEACEFIMDFLKRDAPFWKKELTAEGDYWVEQKDSDLEAAARWQD